MRSRRRLAAVAFTDMVGYTALAQRDEAAALRLLEAHNSLLRPVFRRHGGREVKTIGDSFLLEFQSALDAVQAGVDVQAALSRRNASVRETDRFQVRVGIHVGDVVERDGDILGDAVNIASRVVPFAEAGGVCFTEEVYAQVKNKVDFQVEKLPERRLKNVQSAVDIYRVVLSSEASPAHGPDQASNRIAVLPFTNISPNPRDSYLADGLTEELTSALSGVQGLRVIAQTSTNRYRDGDKDVSRIREELNASHVLDGSVRKAGDKIRVATRLIETASQEQVWAAQYDRDLDDVLSIQSNIARSVIDSLRLKLLPRARTRMEREDTQVLAAYVAYLRGRTLLRGSTEKGALAAREQFELAIREDPHYAKAYAGLADTYVQLSDYLFAPVPVALGQAREAVRKALELDPNLAEARVSFAELLMYDHKFTEAEAEFRRAIEMHPSYATAHHKHSWSLQTLGRLNEALDELMTAEELDPLSPAITMSAIYRLLGFGKYDEVKKRIHKLRELGAGVYEMNEAQMVYHFARRDWPEALHYLQRMRTLDPGDPYLDMDLGYINAVTGRRARALKLAKKLKRVPETLRIKGQLLAFVYVGLGDLDAAFEWLDHALKNKEMFIGWVRGHPLFEPLRKDPRFRALLKRAKVPVD